MELVILSQCRYLPVVLCLCVLPLQKLVLFGQHEHLQVLDVGLAKPILYDIVDVLHVVHLLAIRVLLGECGGDHKREAQVVFVTEHALFEAWLLVT